MYYEELILIMIILFLPLIAQFKVKHNYNKYSKIKNSVNMTGREVAQKILEMNGISYVKVNKTYGFLSDHYNPKNKMINLSEEIYESNSISAISVAAHECGHAIQHKTGYKPLKFRSSLVPIVNFSSYAGYLAIVIGALASWVELIYLGILLECVILLFELITLPVEFDASKRGLKELNNGFLTKDEVKGAKKVLKAAAYTYVASVANTALQILRLVLMFGRRRR